MLADLIFPTSRLLVAYHDLCMAMDEQWSSPERATLIRLADDLGRAAGIKVTAERLTQPHRTVRTAYYGRVERGVTVSFEDYIRQWEALPDSAKREAERLKVDVTLEGNEEFISP